MNNQDELKEWLMAQEFTPAQWEATKEIIRMVVAMPDDGIPEREAATV